ncbi:MAG: TolC family protein [Xanthomonadales bacterium]|nr:TolC family protein [Xanthomonadales bacterium]
MIRHIFRRFIGFTSFTLLGLCAPALVFAQADNFNWDSWILTQVEQHPDIVAAREQMNSTYSLAEARERPLYNPELDTEYEREGNSNNYRVGLNQTLDIWGKRNTRKQQAGFSRTAAQQQYRFAIQQKIAESLQALIEWQAASKQSELALAQETQMETLISLVTDRQLAGDLGQVDAELTLLSFSQRLNATAQAQSRLRQVEARLQELLPDWSANANKIPENLWVTDKVFSTSPEQIKQWLNSHNAVIAAKADWELLQRSAQLANLETKADPTIGLNAGKSAGDNVIALNFSIPLHIRNNFNAEARAANQQALAAEAQYMATKRRQQFAIVASKASLQEYQQRYQRWQGLMQGRGERSGSLLEMQWQSGDLSTTEYLLALQQRSEGLAAGIELGTQFYLARIDWLFQTGQLKTALQQLTQ